MSDSSINENPLARLIELSAALKETQDIKKTKGDTTFGDIYLRSVSKGEESFVLKEKYGWWSRGLAKFKSLFSRKITPYNLESNLKEITKLLDKAAKAEPCPQELTGKVKDTLNKSFNGDVRKAVETLQKYINQINITKNTLISTRKKVDGAATNLITKITTEKRNEIEGRCSNEYDRLTKQHDLYDLLLEPNRNLNNLLSSQRASEKPLQKVSDHLDKLTEARDAVISLKTRIEAECITENVNVVGGVQELAKTIDALDDSISKLEQRQKQLNLADSLRNDYCTYSGHERQTNHSAPELLTMMNRDGHKKIFLLIPNNDDITQFILYVLDKSPPPLEGTLSINDAGQYEVKLPPKYTESFASIDKLMKKLGTSAITAKIDARNKELREISKTNLYNSKVEAEQALNKTMNNDTAKTLDTHVYYLETIVRKGEEVEIMHILSHEAGSDSYDDYSVDFEMEPGKIFLRNEHGYVTRDFDEAGVRRDLGEPLDQLNENLPLYVKKQEFYTKFQNDIYTYDQLGEQGVKVSSNDFGPLKLKLWDKFQKCGENNSQYLLVADNNEPTKANFTLISYVPQTRLIRTTPSQILMDKVSIGPDGKVTLQPINLDGQPARNESKFANITELNTYLQTKKSTSLKQNMQTKLTSLEATLNKYQTEFQNIKDIILDNSPPKSPIYNKQQLKQQQIALVDFSNKVKSTINQSGVTWKDPEILQQIDKELATVKLRIEIEKASNEFLANVSKAESYPEIDGAHTAMEMLLKKCTNRQEYNMSVEEIKYLLAYHSSIESQKREELLPQYLDSIPEQSRELLKNLKTPPEDFEIENRRLEIHFSLTILKSFQQIPGANLSKLEEAIGTLIKVDKILAEKGQQAVAAVSAVAHGGSGQGSGIVITGDGNTITFNNRTSKSGEEGEEVEGEEVEATISGVAAAILSPESFARIGLVAMGLTSAFSLPVAGVVALAGAAVPVIAGALTRKYLPTKAAKIVSPLIQVASALYFQYRVIPALASYSNTPAAAAQQAAVQQATAPPAADKAASPQAAAPAAAKVSSPKAEEPVISPYRELKPMKEDLIDLSTKTQPLDLGNIKPAAIEVDAIPTHPAALQFGTAASSQPIKPIMGQFVSQPPNVPVPVSVPDGEDPLKGQFGPAPVTKFIDYMWGTNLAEFDLGEKIVEKLPSPEVTAGALLAVGLTAATGPGGLMAGAATKVVANSVGAVGVQMIMNSAVAAVGS